MICSDTCKIIDFDLVHMKKEEVNFSASYELNFHKNSTEIIQNAVHKKDESGALLPFHITANNLLITQVDIQSIDPVEEETRKSLQKSVNMAFEIQTRSQEAAAQH